MRYRVCSSPRQGLHFSLRSICLGLRGSVGVFLASIPLLVGMPKGQVYFDVAFVIVLFSLLVQGSTIAPAARLLRIALPRTAAAQSRVGVAVFNQNHATRMSGRR